MVRSRANAGFALIEVVIMVIVLGILSAVAVPAYVNLQQGAKQSAEDAVVANVRTGISLVFAQAAINGQPAYLAAPGMLSNGQASDQNSCVLLLHLPARQWTGSCVTGRRAVYGVHWPDRRALPVRPANYRQAP
ncbi:MAG: hypothetical protein U1E76_16190 [Planctomycetota bacterium]